MAPTVSFSSPPRPPRTPKQDRPGPSSAGATPWHQAANLHTSAGATPWPRSVDRHPSSAGATPWPRSSESLPGTPCSPLPVLAPTGTSPWKSGGFSPFSPSLEEYLRDDSFTPDSVSLHRKRLNEPNPFPLSFANQPFREVSASFLRSPLSPLPAGVSLRNTTPIVGNDKESTDLPLSNKKQVAFNLSSESGDISRFVPKTHFPTPPRSSLSVGRTNLILPRQETAISSPPRRPEPRQLESNEKSSHDMSRAAKILASPLSILRLQMPDGAKVSTADSAKPPAPILSSKKCLDWIAVTGFESSEHFLELIDIFRRYGEFVDYERDFRAGVLSFRYASPSQAAKVFDVAQAASLAGSARRLALPELLGSPKKFLLRLTDGQSCTVYLGARLARPNQIEVTESAPLMFASATEHKAKSNCVGPTAAQLPARPTPPVLLEEIYVIPPSKGPGKLQAIAQFVATQMLGSNSAAQVGDEARSIKLGSIPPPAGAAAADATNPLLATPLREDQVMIHSSQEKQPALVAQPAVAEAQNQRPRLRDSICDKVGWVLLCFFFPHVASLADEQHQVQEDHSASTASKDKND
jgi:hypothetical protein